MATFQTRPFSRDYSGLVNQSALAVGIIVICTSAHEIMKRRRRGKVKEDGLGSVESWQFGYLYQGRSWAKIPSPPTPRGWPLSWVKEVILFPESRIHELRGMDATLYNRFLRGCFWFALLQTFTTSAILLPIHLKFSNDSNSLKSMNRALISSLVDTAKGKGLLWVHVVLIYWVTISWVFILVWIAHGAFSYRAATIENLKKTRSEAEGKANATYLPHPHPQHPFHAMPPLEQENYNRGLKLRTVMVTNIPRRMRTEKELQEYFEHYMSRPLVKPSIGLTSGTQPGFFNKMATFAFNRVRGWRIFSHAQDDSEMEHRIHEEGGRPEIQCVVLARRMTELASLLDDREEMLKRLETAHIKLARKVLSAVKIEMEERDHGATLRTRFSKYVIRHDPRLAGVDVEREIGSTLTNEARMDLLIESLGSFVNGFGMRKKRKLSGRDGGANRLLSKLTSPFDDSTTISRPSSEKDKAFMPKDNQTIWEALYGLPREVLHPYQPLVRLSALFRGKAVPSIDYHTAKVDFLSKLIAEKRGSLVEEYDPVSTAFVTFVHPDDARRAVNYLTVHPDNPLACLVTMAPDYEDIDWVRVMKSRFKAELLKDWVVNLGVWAFTIIWVIPVSLLVALVSIQNIDHVWPGLQTFLDNHAYLEDVISSFVPTLLTSLLMLLVPMLLLLIAKKAHTINTLSALHDLIMTRYHKFLVANILVFFCVGVTALESFFTSFKNSLDILTVVGDSFPIAGPFYVGWIIFTMGIHGGIELVLFGLPLFVYPATKRALTPRRRAVGIRPRTFNYYYWLPNHVLIITITTAFAVLNPLMTPFVLLYFTIEQVVVKNQFIHVYAKVYEGQGSLMLVRIIRYTLDGLILAQIIFLGFSAVVKKEVHVAMTAVLIAFTVITKLMFTRVVRVKTETADILEAREVCGVGPLAATAPAAPRDSDAARSDDSEAADITTGFFAEAAHKTWKLKKNFVFDYSGMGQASRPVAEHKPNPFNDQTAEFKRMNSWNGPSTSNPYDAFLASPMQKSTPNLSDVPAPPPAPPAPPPSNPEYPPSEKAKENSSKLLVTPHDKHPPWDDSSRLDRPYDNPYYARPLPNYLWLPRNPVGLLDLDDTVNVHKSLTTDPMHEVFGEIVEGGVGVTDAPIAFTSSPEASEQPLDDYPLPRQLSGDEEITLPPAIADRVDKIDQEDDVEYTDGDRPSLLGLRRPSTLSHRRSTISSTHRKASLPMTRPTSSRGAEAGPSSFARGRSGSVVSTASFARHSSMFNPSESIRRYRSASQFGALGEGGPGVQSTASLPRSRLSMLDGSLDLHDPEATKSGHLQGQTVTAREAIVNEVIVEEVQASENRQKEEEAVKATEIVSEERSWLTRWMFARHHET